MPRCTFEGYCDLQNMVNPKVCLAKEGQCNYQDSALVVDENTSKQEEP